MTEPRQRSYEVGYARPPKATQFRKGQSGNPNGRPRGSKKKVGFDQMMIAALDAPVAVKLETGELTSISKWEAIMRGLFQNAIVGDVEASQLILQYQKQLKRVGLTEPNYVIVSGEEGDI